MSSTELVLIAVAAIALLLLLILKLKLHPFVALLLVSILTALVGGIPPAKLATTIEEGMGKTLGHIALIIPLGAMIGRMIEHSGGAAAFARSLVARFSGRRAPLALTIAGFMIGIPVFFEVGVIMLMPMAYGVARTTGKPLLQFALPMCIALLIVHALLPPHPGPVAAAGLLGADMGRILLLGLPIAAVTTVCAYFISKLMTRREYAMADEIRAEVYGSAPGEQGSGVASVAAAPDSGRAPGVATVVALILTPIVLIMLGTLATTLLPAASTLRSVLVVLGAPFIALLLDVLLCAWILGVRRGWSRKQVADVIGSAIPGIAIVILITGAGGVFAQILVASGIGNAISELLRSTGLPVLGLGFVVTMLLRAAQGPTTVALITTAGIIAPVVAQAGFNANQLALICVAMGAGGLSVSHVNDAGYWIVTRLVGLNVADGLRTWTVLTTCSGVIAFAITALLWSRV
jgi:GntP family gluconate:H+ symporter